MAKVSYIQRYLIIIRLIKNNRYISLDELVQRVDEEMSLYEGTDIVGTSKRTIQRDLNEIRREFDISINYSRAEGGYYVPEDEDSLSMIERVMESYDILGSLFASKNLNKIIFTEKRQSRGTEHLSPLIYAIQHAFVVEFFYRKYNSNSGRTRLVEPYAIKEFNGRWYLLAPEVEGKLEKHGPLKTWGLDRIMQLKVTSRHFLKDSTLKVDEEFEGCFGIFSDRAKPIEEVILSFTPQSGKYVKSLPLHSSQEVLADDDKEFRIKLKIRVTLDFVMELLSYSGEMKIISPLHLRQEMKDRYQKALTLF